METKLRALEWLKKVNYLRKIIDAELGVGKPTGRALERVEV